MGSRLEDGGCRCRLSCGQICNAFPFWRSVSVEERSEVDNRYDTVQGHCIETRIRWASSLPVQVHLKIIAGLAK